MRRTEDIVVKSKQKDDSGKPVVSSAVNGMSLNCPKKIISFVKDNE
jgi:hypothetical protein